MKRFIKSGLSLALSLTIVLCSALVGLGEIDWGGLFAVKAEAASSGTCGPNVTWTYSNGTLTISGKGNMSNYGITNTPWNSFKNCLLY